MKTLAGILVATSFIALAAGYADAKLGPASGGKVEFTAKGPGGLNIVGKSSNVAVNDDGSAIVVSVPIEPISTGIDLRDKHMRNALEASTYPKAELSVPRANVKFPADGASASGEAEGTLKLHGQAKPVKFHYDAQRKGAAVTVQATAAIVMTDFGVTPPKYLGVGVAPGVNIAVGFTAPDQ